MTSNSPGDNDSELVSNSERLPVGISNQSKIATYEKYSRDIALMLQHCRDKGIALPEQLAGQVAKIYQEDAEAQPGLKLLLQVHGQLSAVITPATPRSLAITDFSSSESRYLWLLMGFLILAAAIGLIGYILTLANLKPAGSPTPAASLPGASLFGGMSPVFLALASIAPHIPSLGRSVLALSVQLSTQLNYLFAAMLGAAFYGMLTAYDYIKNRSFDPGYYVVYVVRFVVGVVAGVILANLGANVFQGNEILDKLGPGIVALLGGYSAEAVRQILDRLVEVLITVVKGQETSDKDRLEVAKDQLSLAAEKDRLDVAKDILLLASEPGLTTDVQEKLKEVVEKLQKG
jgi:hypothetical protein